MRMGAKSWSRNTNAGAPFPGSITKAASGVCLNEFAQCNRTTSGAWRKGRRAALRTPRASPVRVEPRTGLRPAFNHGDGSRAIVHVSAGGKGHVFIAENVRGKISYVDPQVNKRYSNINLSQVSNAQLTRLDNQDFTEYARNAFTRKRV